MGLLDGLNMNDPQTLGLLGAAAQMLQSSGPSLMPHSFGQVMGAGVQGLNQGVQTGIDRQKEQMQLMLQQAQVAQALRQGAAIQPIYDAIGRKFSGQQANAPAGVPAQQSASPVNQSVPVGTVAPDGRTISTPNFIQPPDSPASQQTALQSGGGMFGLSDDGLMGGVLAGPAELGKAIIAANSPTDLAKQLRQAGIDPGSALGRQLMQANIAKQNYVAPVNARPGSIMRDPFDPTKVVAFNPHIPDGGMPSFDANGNVTAITPLSGAADVAQTMSRAGAAGKASVTPTTAFDEQGNPVFTNQLDAATGGRQGVQQVPPWRGGKLSDADFAKIKAGADAGDPNSQMVLASYTAAQGGSPAGRLSPQLKPGVEKSIVGNVDTMKSDFEDLQAANKNAPTTLALLNNIKKLAPQAIAGSQADKLSYVNGLLTLGGMQGAKDLATATDLLNKNANMLAINMRLGANGGGSDALQSLAQAANPNSHMQPDAVIKAADEVIGQVKMKQDQYQKLLPYRMKNDYQGYFNTQNDFLKGADPHNYQPQQGKVATLSDIAATARASGKTTAEVTAALKANGYTIGGQ